MDHPCSRHKLDTFIEGSWRRWLDFPGGFRFSILFTRPPQRYPSPKGKKWKRNAASLLTRIDNKYAVHTKSKLLPELMIKTYYIVYCRNLKYFWSLGMKLQKIHRIMKFKQRAWLKPYIKFNIADRKNAWSLFTRSSVNPSDREWTSTWWILKGIHKNSGITYLSSSKTVWWKFSRVSEDEAISQPR